MNEITRLNELDTILNKIDDLGNHLSNIMLYGHRVTNELTQRAIIKSADYVEKNMKDAVIITKNSKEQMWDCATSKIKIDGHIAEFGVFGGHSINYLSKNIYPKTIFGFDSFFGLLEDFVLDCPKGTFNLDGFPPEVNSNVELVPGFFSETVPKWLKENPGSFSFLNIDCDTYESTSLVLNSIGPTKIVPGTIILFDEYFGFHGWENCEFKAWQEYCKINNVKYKYLAIGHLQVLIEVL
jgi:hypothetical protein